MKINRLKIFALLFLFQTVIFYSCNEDSIQPSQTLSEPLLKTQASLLKNQTEFSKTEEQAFNDIKSWYIQNIKKNNFGKKGTRHIGWDGVVSSQLGSGNNWMFTVPVFDHESLLKIKKLVVFQNEGEVRTFEIEITPDNESLEINGLSVDENFSGNIKIYNSSRRLVKNVSISNGAQSKENSLSSLKGLSTLNFGGFDGDPCDDPTVTCLDEVIVVGTPLPTVIWLIVPYPWQPSWDPNDIGTDHGEWNQSYAGWNVHVPTQSGPTKITQAMLESMIADLANLSPSEKLERIAEYLKELGDAYIDGATLRAVVGGPATHDIKEIRKSGDTITVKFESNVENIEYPVNKLITATLENDNAFIFDTEDDTEIYITAYGVTLGWLGSVKKIRVNADGVQAFKLFTWHDVIEFD